MLPADDEFRKWPSIQKMVYGLANKVHGRVLASRLGHRMSIDDLVQEGALTWLQACERFDPQFEVKFTTYLHRAVLTNLNRYVHNNGNIKHGVTARMDSMTQPLGDGDEGATKTLEEVINAGMVQEPDTILEMEQDIDSMLNNLSPKAKIIYGLIISPPKWLREEFRASKDQAKLRRDLNIRPAGNAPPDIIVIASIAKAVWGIDDAEFKGIRTEIWRIQYGN